MSRASKNTHTELVQYEDHLPTAFRSAFDATKKALSMTCTRCDTKDEPTTFYITCTNGCVSCDMCPKVFKDEEFFCKMKMGESKCTHRGCQAEALPKPVENSAYKTAKSVLKEVDAALIHGVSVIKDKGYVTKAMEEGEEAPDWVPIPPKEALLKAKTEIAATVMKMKSEGKKQSEIDAYLCGDSKAVEEEEEEEEEEPEEPATKRARKELTPEQLARKEARKEENRRKREETKRENTRRLNEYPFLKENYLKLKNTIKEARQLLLSTMDPDDVTNILGEEEDDSSDDESELAVPTADDED